MRRFRIHTHTIASTNNRLQDTEQHRTAQSTRPTKPPPAASVRDRVACTACTGCSRRFAPQHLKPPHLKPPLAREARRFSHEHHTHSKEIRSLAPTDPQVKQPANRLSTQHSLMKPSLPGTSERQGARWITRAGRLQLANTASAWSNSDRTSIIDLSAAHSRPRLVVT